jgi:hypothetical protein
MNDRRHSSGAGLVLREAVEARQEAPPTPVLPEKSIAECLDQVADDRRARRPVKKDDFVPGE